MQIYEKDIEDWAEASLAALVGVDDVEILGRQLRLPTGRILDLLAFHEAEPGWITLVVIELKRDTANERAVLQVLDYMGTMAQLSAPLMQSMQVRGDPRGVRVEGILAARAITEDAARYIAALDQVRFVQLSIQFTCRTASLRPYEHDGGELSGLADMWANEFIGESLLPPSRQPHASDRDPDPEELVDLATDDRSADDWAEESF